MEHLKNVSTMYNADEQETFNHEIDDLTLESGLDMMGDALDKISVSLIQIEGMLTFESALASEEDPAKVRELIIVNFGDSDEDTLTVESAVEAKTELLGKIGTVIDWAVSNVEENSTFVLDIIKNRLGDSTSDLESLKNKVMMVEGNTAPVSSLRNKLTNSYLGVFTGMGLNINSTTDIIKFINMPREVLLPLFKENAKFFDSFGNLNNRTMANSVALGVLKKSDKSIAFIKSLKNVRLKNLDFVAGFPTKLTAMNCSFVTASINEGGFKLSVDTNSVKMPTQHIKRVSQADAVKIIDATIKMVQSNQGIYKEVKDLMYSLGVFIGWLRGVTGTGGLVNVLDPRIFNTIKGFGGLGSIISKAARFNAHFAVATKSLARSNHDMKNFVKSYIQTAYIS